MEACILRNLPLKFLYDDWKRVSKALPGASFKETHNWQPKCLTSKKYRKTSIVGEMSSCEHKIVKSRINAQLFGCS